MTPIDKLGMGERFQTFDLDRSMDYPGDRHSKEGRNLYNVIDWTGQHRGQIALTPAERDAIQPLKPSADAITSLIAERDGLAEQLRVSDLEGNHAFALAVDDPGKNPPILWKDRALAVEAQLKAAREALDWALDEIDALSNRAHGFAYPQGMQFSRRVDQMPNYERAVAVRRALSLDTKGDDNGKR